MEVMCPVCGKEMDLFAQNKDRQKKSDQNLYAAYECKSCNILFQYPFWKPEETLPFYETNYYAHTDNGVIPRAVKLLDFYMKDHLSGKLSSSLRKKLFPYFPGIMQSKKILDIGCGKGVFLDLMKKYNKKTFGLEPSGQASAISAGKGHVMIDKTFFYSSEKEVKFDLITMFQVAEHLSVQEIFDEDIFSAMYDSLEVGGHLIIETPNYECDYAKEYKSDWRAMELPRHLVIFSPKSIAKMLTDKGFSTKVYTRISPIDVRETFKLKYKDKSLKNKLLKAVELCKIALFQKKNSSLLTVVAQKI